MKIVKSIFFLLVVFGLRSCTGSASKEISETDKNSEFDQLLNEYHHHEVKLDPIEATFNGDNSNSVLFPNYVSDAYREEQLGHYTEYIEKVSQFDDKDLNASEKMSKEIMIWECKIKLEGLNYRDDFLPIDQMWSVNLRMGQLASGESAQPFNTVQDYKNWLERVNGYLEWMKTAEIKMRMGIDSGYVLPKSLIVKVVPQLEAMTNDDIESHLFYSPVKKFPESFSQEEKDSLTRAYKAMVEDKVIPAYKKLVHFIESEYLPAGRESSGYGALPRGREDYAYRIKKYTTTNMTADEVFQLGEKEVARIRAEMEKVKDEVVYEGDLKSFFDFVRNNPDLMPYTAPGQVLDHFRNIYERMIPQLNKLFSVKPKTAFEIKRTEAFREKSASAEYNSPAKDGSRPGTFYVPIPDIKKYNIYSDESLFLHEAIPGHHYQIALTLENEELPEFRKFIWYGAYGEGWALYAESLGRELGLYTDPYQYFGMLSAEMHRAIRLVVDAGIHAKGWTREQAIQYSLDNEAESEAGIVSEIERYMANPGQALSYKIGQLKIRELRARAEDKLGDKFDIREFHWQVLKNGCVPLELLEEHINDWIDNYKD